MEEPRKPAYTVEVFDGKVRIVTLTCDVMEPQSDGRTILYTAGICCAVIQPGLSVSLAGRYVKGDDNG